MAIDGADETSADGDGVEADGPVEPDEPDEADESVEPEAGATEPTEATGPVDPAETEAIAATSGACPICGEAFDDLASYSSHLAEEHDLHDDDGAESSFGTVLVAPPPLPAAAMRSDLLEGPPPRPAGPGDRGRPWGLIVLVFGLALVLAGLLAFGPRPGGDDEVAQVGDEGTTTTEGGAGTPSTAPPTSGEGGTGTTTPPKDGGANPPTSAPSTPTTVTSGGGGEVAPRPTTTTTVPSTTTTTKPPATFTAPTTSGARIDGCQRVKNRWRITYSWRFDGGSGWRVPAGYRPTGGGRYQAVIEVPRAGTTLIALVQVLDQANRSHDVALRPVLSSDAC